ncbi:MFS transporter [Streptomyces sp. NPDC059743]|uniref:MFS transporter n=1 Tax=Streptomyces sp. NPDC059743 TaxID=3346928 RepID=UPI003665E4BE
MPRTPSKPLVLVALLLAAFVINLDTTLVNVALPTLTRELGATDSQLQWVVDAYNLVFAALLLTSGSLSDRFGRRGMLMAGLLVFGVASFVGGYSTSPEELIAARAVMGLGAAMTFPATLALLTDVFTTRKERALSIGLWGATAGVAITLGPIVGGFLLERYSWGSIFYTLGPVSLAVIIPSSSWWRCTSPGRGARSRTAWTTWASSCPPASWGCSSTPSSRPRTAAGPPRPPSPASPGPWRS